MCIVLLVILKFMKDVENRNNTKRLYDNGFNFVIQSTCACFQTSINIVHSFQKKIPDHLHVKI